MDYSWSLTNRNYLLGFRVFVEQQRHPVAGEVNPKRRLLVALPRVFPGSVSLNRIISLHCYMLHYLILKPIKKF